MKVLLFMVSVVGMVALSAYILHSIFWILFPLPGFVLPLKAAAERIDADYWSVDQVIEDCTSNPAQWVAYVKDKTKQNNIRRYAKTPEEAVAKVLEAMNNGEWERLCTTTTLKSYSIIK